MNKILQCMFEVYYIFVNAILLVKHMKIFIITTNYHC